jgi:hypothetical protein
VARELADRGWTDVHPLEGGFDAWERAHYPVEPKGDDDRIENRGAGGTLEIGDRR